MLGQSNWLIATKKKRVGLVRHPQLINMKHNKYTQLISPSWKSWSTVLKIEISCSQWQSSACTTRGLSFNFWVLGEKGGMGDVFTVLNLFSLCSHQDPNGFLKLLPIEPQFYPILFGHSSTFMHISYKGRNGVPKALPVGDWPIFQKNWPINVTPSKKNPKIAGSPMNWLHNRRNNR